MLAKYSDRVRELGQGNRLLSSALSQLHRRCWILGKMIVLNSNAAALTPGIQGIQPSQFPPSNNHIPDTIASLFSTTISRKTGGIDNVPASWQFERERRRIYLGTFCSAEM